jgi:hypothetical protein
MDVGITVFGAPNWLLSSTMPSLDWLPSFEMLLLDLGLLLTLYVSWRLAARFRLSFVKTLRLNAPWAALAVALYSIGVWIIFQPMQMRGMMMDSVQTTKTVQSEQTPESTERKHSMHSMH